MGRPPCCDKGGVRKGPWTPEEDLVLVSYVHDHGPGNWRAVAANTGLMRCSKSCRLRWTNYLRPGIKRGNFTDQEEKLIVHLQALLGNRWAAISSYLPERTDNDIKNYWNTHLKKKLAKMGGAFASASGEGAGAKGCRSAALKGQWERRLQTDIHTARQALRDALSLDSSSSAPPAVKSEPPRLQAPTYASSVENIARLLEGWMRPAPAVSGGASTSHSGTARTPDGSTWTSFAKADDLAAAAVAMPGPAFSMLESWLLDDGMGHGDAGFMGMGGVLLADP